MAVIGIDLGTTNSLVVAYIDGQVKVIPNQFGEYLTPSVVSMNKDREFIVGKIAKERLVTHPNLTACLFKRKMGEKDSYTLGQSEYLPEELSSMVVKQLIEDAKRELNEDIEEVVISVPAYFNAKQRDATKRVGTILGVEVKRLINEPSAAAIACRQDDQDQAYIVFDFGGGTLDVSIVDCFDNVISICAISGDNNLGGSNFDEVIMRYFCQQNDLVYEMLIPSHQRSLMLNAERVKLALQTEEAVIMKVTINETTYQTIIDRETLKEISIPIFTRVRTVLQRALKDSGFEVDEIDGLILVGGSCHMPIVKDYLDHLLKVPVIETGDKDLLVAQGLGKYIGIKNRDESVKNIVVTDICPYSLSTAVISEGIHTELVASVLIPKNSVLPISSSNMYSTSAPHQDKVKIEVFQGEKMHAYENLLLGRTTIPLPKIDADYENFTLTYSYDINSMLFIEILIHSNQRKYLLTIGDNDQLVEVQDAKSLEIVKNLSLQLHQDPEITLLEERIGRLYEESEEHDRERLVKFSNKLKIDLEACQNNIHRRLEVIGKCQNILDQVESYQQGSANAFFNDEEDEGNLVS